MYRCYNFTGLSRNIRNLLSVGDYRLYTDVLPFIVLIDEKIKENLSLAKVL